jgi:hypothetical protein
MVHSDNRLASIIAMGIFATGVAASMLLILAHDLIVLIEPLNDLEIIGAGEIDGTGVPFAK